eukprot:1098877_1
MRNYISQNNMMAPRLMVKPSMSADALHQFESIFVGTADATDGSAKGTGSTIKHTISKLGTKYFPKDGIELMPHIKASVHDQKRTESGITHALSLHQSADPSNQSVFYSDPSA